MEQQSPKSSRNGVEKGTVDRRTFISKFMRAGLTYSQATRLYEVMCGVFEDGIVSGNRISIGRVGALVPSWRPPRDINMHFRIKKGRMIERGVHRTYYVDGRYEFRFKLYKKFMDTRQLHWFLDMPIS
jgi:hypothetical protein